MARAGKVLFALSGVGAGLYGAQAYRSIYIAEQDAKGQQQVLTKQENARKAIEVDVQKHEQEATSLIQARQAQRKVLEELGQQLSEARQRVSELEAQHSSKDATLSQLEKDVLVASQKVADLRQEALRRREATMAAEQALREARRRQAEARAAANPLNHPLLKDLFK